MLQQPHSHMELESVISWWVNSDLRCLGSARTAQISMEVKTIDY